MEWRSLGEKTPLHDESKDLALPRRTPGPLSSDRRAPPPLHWEAEEVEREDLDEERGEPGGWLAEYYRRIIQEIGEDPDREGLRKTPERAAEAMRFLTRGYQQDLPSILNGAIFEEPYDDMIIVRDIEFYSLCEHHLLPFFGYCHVGYLPNGRIIGVSKIARVVEMFARRLQLQERLTHQIAIAMQEVLNPLGVGVVMEARHLCMMIRGVEKQNSKLVTSAVLGLFRSDPRTRDEFMRLLKDTGE